MSLIKTLSLNSPEAEAELIGCLLYDNSKMADLGYLNPSDFFVKKYDLFFQIIREGYEAGEEVTPTLLLEGMHAKGFLDTDDKRFQCEADIAEMVKENFSVEAAKDYAKLCKEHSVKRQIHILLNDCVSSQRTDAWASGEFISETMEKLNELQKQVATDKKYESVSESIGDYLQRITSEEDYEEGNPTGYFELDEFLNGGLKKGKLSIIAARPGIGKTTLSQNIAIQVAKNGGASLFISLEMPHDELMGKALSAESKVALSKIEKQGQNPLNDQDFAFQSEAAKSMADWDFFNVVQSGITVLEVEQQINNVNRDLERQGKDPLVLVVIDYLQLMGSTRKGGQRSRENDVSEISAAVKALTLKYGIHIILASQLNREVEKRSDKTPKLWDLRESGSLEQDADIVLLLHREDSDDTTGGALDHQACSVATIQVAKNRNGKVGRLELDFYKHRSKFENPFNANV